MIYTHPEVAWVGKTEEMLKEEVTEQSEKKVRGWSGDDGIKLLIYLAMSCILINYKHAQATEYVDSTTSLNRCKLNSKLVCLSKPYNYVFFGLKCIIIVC